MQAKLIGGVISPVVMFGVALFGFAWTLDWPRAWILLAVVAVLATATMYGVFAHSPQLLDERYKPAIQRGQPLADQIITPLIGVAFFALLAFIPRDVFHYALLGRPSNVVAALGLVVFVSGWTLIALAFRANAFAAPIVKHQDDQHVIDRGPYAVIRHPMYAAALLMFIGMPLWLGSYAGALAALVAMLPLIARTLVEDRTLRRDLPGYTDYARRVRWRIVPWLW